MPSLMRWALVASLPLLGLGAALARGKKQAAPVEAAPAVETAPAAPAAPPAPALFPAGLPVADSALPPGLASLSAQSCNGCHWSAHDTWATSGHAHAWSDPLFQAALTRAGNSTACTSCHLPNAAQHDELAAGYIEGDVTRPRLEPNPSFDAALMSEGVSCVACHVREGTVIGTTASTNSPHPVVASAELRQSELCATCHQLSWPESDRPFYDTYGEWKASAYATAGVSCQSCHMAPVAGVAQPGEAGVVPAHSSPTTLTRALTTLVSLRSASLLRGQTISVPVTLLNTGAGHSVPTGNPFKQVKIEVVALDAAGKELAPPQGITLARTVEEAPPWRTTADDRLLAGGKKEFTVELALNAKGAPGMGALVVRAVEGAKVTELRRISLAVR